MNTEQEKEPTREDFDSWYEWIDYISFGSCANCSSGRFYALLGATVLASINLIQFAIIIALLL